DIAARQRDMTAPRPSLPTARLLRLAHPREKSPGFRRRGEYRARRGLSAGGRRIRISSSARDKLRFEVREGVSGASGRPRRAVLTVQRFTRLSMRLCYPRGRVVAIDLYPG